MVVADTAKVDWRTLDAGILLDAVIAERLGWKLVAYGGFWRAFNPQGHFMGVAKMDANYTLVQGALWPEYSADANAALDLPIDSDCELRLFSPTEENNQQWEALLIAENKHDCRSFQAAPALAICRVWLMWKDAIYG